jgi:hypothetical protein
VDVKPGRIQIEIEELTVAELTSPVDGDELGDALRLELERLVAECPPRLESLLRPADRLCVETRFTADSATLGQRVARALHGGFER